MKAETLWRLVVKAEVHWKPVSAVTSEASSLGEGWSSLEVGDKGRSPLDASGNDVDEGLLEASGGDEGPQEAGGEDPPGPHQGHRRRITGGCWPGSRWRFTGRCRPGSRRRQRLAARLKADTPGRPTAEST